MGWVREVKADDFKKEVLESDKPVLIDFWAEWCVPCKKIEPIIEELSEEFKNHVKFLRLNVDENPSIAYEYEIRGIPTLVLFKDGKPVDRIVGLTSRKELSEKITRIKEK
ncbi:thioredoxin [Candidatus Aerophobetes bacterium]|uniref:Thioredoxin n=1 Tax=Aerophobetes bacterium TaxID=2030807 RepID=A0A662DG10_UNCAE|nr:thioredoxin [Candidatus Aerophobetes bacterium]RLE13069.1 MAG: thioredoxin [Candidatus Aerophobetes bacterium]